MNSIKAECMLASEVLAKYGISENKFQERYQTLLSEMNRFLKEGHYDEKGASVNTTILGYTLIDYFVDIKRLEDFHQIKNGNSIKIIAYMAYWLLRRQPIQVSEPDSDLLYLNELFVYMFVLDALCVEELGNIIQREESGLESFKSTFLYFLKFRYYNPQALEMIIMAFMAGQIYQESKKDISDFLTENFAESD